MRLFLITILFMVVGCSTTVTGPITGRQYDLNLGCTDNMQNYKREREQVVEKESESAPPAAKLDCPVVDAPQK